MADSITLNNVGSSAWETTSVNGTNISADTTVENPVINLSNIGTRYIFYNDGYSAHPLEFLDSNGDILLSQSGTGTFESDSTVNWVDNDTSVEFTLTTELSDQITQYRCTVHTTAMAASISSPQTVDYTPSTGSVSITSPDNSSTVVNPFPVSMEATNFVIESTSNGVSDGAGHFHLLIDQPAVTAGEVIPNNPSNGYYHYGDGSTSTELDLSTGEHTIRLQAGDANHRAYNLTDSIGVTVTTVSGSIDTLAKPDKGTPNWHVPLNDNFRKLEASSGSINSTSDGVQIDNPVTNNPFVKFNVSSDGSSNGTLVLANSSIDANNNSITNVDGISVDTLNADSFTNNTTESVQDIVGGLITGQNDANVTYDDTNDQLSIDVSTLTNEEVQDIVGELIVGQNDANVTYDDTNDQLSIDVSTLTNEEVQDVVTSLVASDSNLSWSYDDTNDTLTVSLSDSISVNTLEATGSFIDPQGNTITDFGGIGGSVKFHQSSTPSNPSTGDIWFDTELDILRIYNGSVWESDSSIRTLDEAISFLESDVSVETTDTELFGKGLTTTRPDDDQVYDSEGYGDVKFGLQINPNRDLNGLVGTVSSGSSGFTQIYVIKNSNDKLLASKTVPTTTGGEEIPIEVPLKSGENYKFVVDDNGGILNYGHETDSSPPYSGTALDIVRSITANSPPIWKGISPLEPTEVRLKNGKTTGQTTVTFSDGNTQAYDAVTFQSNEPSSGSDTSSVTCDVIDGNGNTIKSNIPENQSTYLYNIDQSKELQLRFDYSSDASDLNPSITYAALSYIR